MIKITNADRNSAWLVGVAWALTAPSVIREAVVRRAAQRQSRSRAVKPGALLSLLHCSTNRNHASIGEHFRKRAYIDRRPTSALCKIHVLIVSARGDQRKSGVIDGPNYDHYVFRDFCRGHLHFASLNSRLLRVNLILFAGLLIYLLFCLFSSVLVHYLLKFTGTPSRGPVSPLRTSLSAVAGSVRTNSGGLTPSPAICGHRSSPTRLQRLLKRLQHPASRKGRWTKHYANPSRSLRFSAKTDGRSATTATCTDGV